LGESLITNIKVEERMYGNIKALSIGLGFEERIYMKTKYINLSLFYVLLFLLAQTNCVNPPHYSRPNKPPLFRVITSEPPPAKDKGNVKGTVLWTGDGKGTENVEVLLCERIDMLVYFRCEGKNFKTKTDSNGIYWFRDLPAGRYSFAIKPLGSIDSYVAITLNYSVTESMQLEPNQTIEIAEQKIYKMDLKQIAPKTDEIIQDRKPMLRWEAYPGAKSYYVNLYGEKRKKIALNDNGAKSISVTEMAPLDDLPNGTYTWEISVFNEKAERIAESDKRTFTFKVNDTVKPKK